MRGQGGTSVSSFLPSLGVYDSDHKLGTYINHQKPGSLMIKHDNITELYYRQGFGMDIEPFVGLRVKAIDLGVSRKCRSFTALEILATKFNYIHSQILSRGSNTLTRVGSIAYNVLAEHLFATKLSFGGTIEPKTTSRYVRDLKHTRSGQWGSVSKKTSPQFPTSTQDNLLSHWACMGLLRVGGLLEMVSVKTILTLNRNTKTINYTGN